MKKVLMIGALAVSCTTVSVSAAPVTGDIEKGKQKVAQICNACHGLDGNGVAVQTIWPKLAGQNPNYIYKQLTNFKNGERHNVQMTPMAMPLTDDDMRNVAVYFSSQTHKGGMAKADAVAAGESLYRAGNPANGVPACSGCHGPAGLGNNLAKFPRLAGQHAQYVENTLKSFRTMERKNDPNGMMRGVTARMTDTEMAAVAQYIQGLRP